MSTPTEDQPTPAMEATSTSICETVMTFLCDNQDPRDKEISNSQKTSSANEAPSSDEACPGGKTSTTEAEDKDKESAIDDCSICAIAMLRSDDTRKLGCGHAFHTHCIQQWLTINPTCPIDRKVVNGSTRPPATPAQLTQGRRPGQRPVEPAQSVQRPTQPAQSTRRDPPSVTPEMYNRVLRSFTGDIPDHLKRPIEQLAGTRGQNTGLMAYVMQELRHEQRRLDEVPDWERHRQRIIADDVTITQHRERMRRYERRVRREFERRVQRALGGPYRHHWNREPEDAELEDSEPKDSGSEDSEPQDDHDVGFPRPGCWPQGIDPDLLRLLHISYRGC